MVPFLPRGSGGLILLVTSLVSGPLVSIFDNPSLISQCGPEGSGECITLHEQVERGPVLYSQSFGTIRRKNLIVGH